MPDVRPCRAGARGARHPAPGASRDSAAELRSACPRHTRVAAEPARRIAKPPKEGSPDIDVTSEDLKQLALSHQQAASVAAQGGEWDKAHFLSAQAGLSLLLHLSEQLNNLHEAVRSADATAGGIAADTGMCHRALNEIASGVSSMANR